MLAIHLQPQSPERVMLSPIMLTGYQEVTMLRCSWNLHINVVLQLLQGCAFDRQYYTAQEGSIAVVV